MRSAKESSFSRNADLSLTDKIKRLSWTYILLIGLLACTGFVVLYAAANGSWTPWASKQAVRFACFIPVLLAVALIDIRFWFRYAYVVYAAGVLALVYVGLFGHVGMGAQRWIDLGVVQVQPSELAKIGVVLALSRYFHGATLQETGTFSYMAVPALLLALPCALIFSQPDLGTTLHTIFVGVALFFLAGVQMWKFMAAGGAILVSLPVFWHFLKDYQKERVLTFLDPERDPLGKGYHILQSKITLGSGGVFGKGFLQGTQSRLNFLPEKHTDFIFTVWAEEFGLIGSAGLLFLFLVVIFYGYYIAFKSTNFFGRFLAIGLSFNLFLYVVVNTGMVMGLLPVVGTPLPMVSYGGTAMLTLMVSFGLIESVNVHQNIEIGRRGSYEN